MRRWSNEPLPPAPHIAVIANDAIGNFVIATSMAVMLRRRFPSARLELWSGSRVRELVGPGCVFDALNEFLREPEETVRARAAQSSSLDLVINIEDSEQARALPRLLCGAATRVCGPALTESGESLAWPDDDRGALWADRAWTSLDVRARHPFLQSPYIGEFFCRLAYLEGDVPQAQVRQEQWDGEQPDVLIAMSASLPEKIWSNEGWVSALEGLRDRGLSVGLVGAAPGAQKAHWLGVDAEDDVVKRGLAVDLRGALRLPQVVSAMMRARLVLTLDNGIMHLAATTPVPVVALFRHGIHRLWKPSWGHVDGVVAGQGKPVATITAAEVTAACSRALAAPPCNVT
ncbi:MAG: glycosyltransferase family 9 protein [Bacteroidia bacterium]|nr:glycosyltransferase family 9 protein [Bacteroidia bacterium]